jgi:hypothetical protein
MEEEKCQEEERCQEPERQIVFPVPDTVVSSVVSSAVAEQAIPPLCVGRRNWLHLGGDGGLRPRAVLLSLAASVKRHGVNPWAYLTHVLTQVPGRRPGADLTDLLPDEWTCAQAGLLMGAG